ncbi:transposase [Escherichia coli]|uniref:transposase n=1 Tax=Escherichia coli TaxID=562 RepID=UPI00386018E9
MCLLPGAGRGRCLLTSEKVASAADARRIVSHYERRWLIEKYHKAWKSGGTCVESLRMQTRDNLERMVVIKAFIAVRVLDLRQGGISEETQNDSCEKILTPTEWKLLWVKLEGKPLPSQTPTLKWTCLKLGRWHDSKRTSRPG